MATAERDFYAALGVTRSASDGEIKKAFRRLARELHPDVSTAPDAQERFRDVAEAYEVLSKPETRELYDRYGEAGLRSGGFQPGGMDFGSLSDIFAAFFGDDPLGGRGRAGRARGADLGVDVEVELAEAASGVSREVSIQAAIACERCGGGGAEPGTSAAVCPTCGGAGRLQQVSRSVFGDFVRTQACPRCGGAGQVIEHPCTLCEGAGRVAEERKLQVQIPAGIHDGQRIRLGGEGHAGDRGAPAGDAYVLVRVRPDARFVRDGNDIVSAVDVTIARAALGGTVAVETLDGEVELELQPGTQPAHVHVLRGRGMPVLQGFGRGDHRVLVNVLVPRRLTDEGRRLLEELERTHGTDAYRGDEGFFEKLKSAFR
ncbi:MAG: molecular chaperone DnaJ [Actinobacteria bacterium]|nr:molecular chaperone DnaJ [Actinomycetota bacterium]